MKRQFLWVAGGRIVAAVLQALMLLLLARAVSPATFGFFSAVFGLGVVAQNVFDMGLGTFVVKERARERDSPLLRRSLQINVGTSVLMGVVGVIVLTALAQRDPKYLAFVPLIVSMAIERTADVRLGLPLADGDARINVTNLVVRRMLALVSFLALTLTTEVEPVLAFGTAAAAAAAVSAVSAHAHVRRSLSSMTTPATMQTTLVASLPFWLNSVATQARNLDALLITMLAGPVTSGLYATASRLTGPLRILPTSLAAVLLPQATRLSASMKARQRWLLGVSKVTGLMLLFYGALTLVLPPLVPLVLGAQYERSVPAVRIVLCGLIFAAVASLLSTTLQGWGAPGYVARVAALTTVLCLAAVGSGALLWGAAGAALGLGISFVFQSVALLVRALQLSRRSTQD